MRTKVILNLATSSFFGLATAAVQNPTKVIKGASLDHINLDELSVNHAASGASLANSSKDRNEDIDFNQSDNGQSDDSVRDFSDFILAHPEIFSNQHLVKSGNRAQLKTSPIHSSDESSSGERDFSEFPSINEDVPTFKNDSKSPINDIESGVKNKVPDFRSPRSMYCKISACTLLAIAAGVCCGAILTAAYPKTNVQTSSDSVKSYYFKAPTVAPTPFHTTSPTHPGSYYDEKNWMNHPSLQPTSLHTDNRNTGKSNNPSASPTYKRNFSRYPTVKPLNKYIKKPTGSPSTFPTFEPTPFSTDYENNGASSYPTVYTTKASNDDVKPPTGAPTWFYTSNPTTETEKEADLIKYEQLLNAQVKKSKDRRNRKLQAKTQASYERESESKNLLRRRESW